MNRLDIVKLAFRLTGEIKTYSSTSDKHKKLPQRHLQTIIPGKKRGLERFCVLKQHRGHDSHNPMKRFLQ